MMLMDDMGMVKSIAFRDYIDETGGLLLNKKK